MLRTRPCSLFTSMEASISRQFQGEIPSLPSRFQLHKNLSMIYNIQLYILKSGLMITYVFWTVLGGERSLSDFVSTGKPWTPPSLCQWYRLYILFSILKKNTKEVKIIHFGLYGVERGHFQDIDTTIWHYMGSNINHTFTSLFIIFFLTKRFFHIDLSYYFVFLFF